MINTEQDLRVTPDDPIVSGQSNNNTLYNIPISPKLKDLYIDQLTSSYEQLSPSQNLSIATFNVKGLNDQNKFDDLMSLASQQHMDILCLTETRITPITGSAYSKRIRSSDYNIYWSCDLSALAYAGVRILLHKSLSKFVQKVDRINNRILVVTLYIKGNIKLDIIGTYMPQYSTTRQEYLSSQAKIISLTSQAL